MNDEPKATKDNENAFKDKLYAEIKRINEFYSEKEAEATELLDQVVGGEKNLEGDAEKLGDLVTRVRSLMGLNIMGVTKIVKKYKKTLVKKGFTKLDANDIIKKDLFPGNKITDLITRTNEATYDVVGIPLDALLNMQTHHFNQMDEKKDKDKPKEDKPKATWADWCMGIVAIFTWQRVLAILVAAGAVVGIIMGGQAISPSFMPAFSAATQAVCHVYVIICIGNFFHVPWLVAPCFDDDILCRLYLGSLALLQVHLQLGGASLKNPPGRDSMDCARISSCHVFYSLR